MPETTIGLFPDVGGTWFLTRCPGEVGTYLALTGRRVGLADAVYCGYATHHVPRAQLGELREKLFAAAPRDRAAVDALVAPFAVPAGEPSLAAERTRIDRCFGHDTVEAILAALTREGSDWSRAILDELAHKAPVSLKVTLQQLRGGKGLDIEAVLIREYRMTQRFMTAGNFAEGVRALLIDKDNTPRWQPPALDQVDDTMVESYFAPLAAPELTFDDT
jgi:enoyl-CoA hydratase